jgi:hypothetical protein
MRRPVLWVDAISETSFHMETLIINSGAVFLAVSRTESKCEKTKQEAIFSRYVACVRL